MKKRKIYGLYRKRIGGSGVVIDTEVIATFWRRQDAERAVAALATRRRRRGIVKVRYYVREVSQYVM